MTIPMIQPGSVKLCSLRQIAHAEYVVAAGANLFGLNFAEARRKVDIETARNIVAEARTLETATHIQSVGVFVDQPVDEINRIADIVGLDLVQLHGSESSSFAESIERPVIRAFRCSPDLLSTIEDFVAQLPVGRLAGTLVDSFHAGHFGGTGVVADWTLAAQAAARHSVILAGGLTPETVAAAIRAVRPLGVDVSSGVEIDGHKNRDRMIQFVAEARASFAELTQSSISI